jgi:hypothetical protein
MYPHGDETTTSNTRLNPPGYTEAMHAEWLAKTLRPMSWDEYQEWRANAEKKLTPKKRKGKR